jgi:hypothetical protein
LSTLTATFCRLLAERPDAVPLGVVHAVTPIAAVRTLLPYLPGISALDLYARAWQVDAAIAVGFGGTPVASPAALDRFEPPHPADLTARAAEHRDPHVVKFTEACLREHARQPDPVYLFAAQHVIDRTPPW